MLIIIASLLIGATLGVGSYYFQKIFVGFFFASIPIVILVAKFSLPFARTGSASGIGDGGILSFYSTIFTSAPQNMQTAIMYFPVFFFGARLITWIYNTVIAGEPVKESAAARKKRILESYGMSSD